MISRLSSVVAAVTVLAGSGTAQAASSRVPVPGTMVALGDSISAGYNVCGWYVPCPSRSWSTGDHAPIASHYQRLLRLDGGIRGHNTNLAVPGATSAGLMAQARRAIELKPGYVTILIGAQDACVRTEREMTPVDTYRRRLDEALAALRDGVPGVRVFVASIPDLRRLWQVGKGNGFARTFWAVGRICQTMLARPTSVKRADVERRDRVRERVMAYNREAAEACAALGQACRTDGGAVFRYRFTLDHISGWDYFHPNADGQRALAELTFPRGFDWADTR
ncbi:SGNH/GDSL hydrolase family protein [Nonomuraea muscovyensis]|jgi:lysophospholipase L1-like esterase|uniref:Lysophospholipase L1-like esterase n=1 Tax=Nonomuraea muscovyensis TaxID=1124761 RepID=A0A7X0F082_9ACTN|nr:SGNH/GDSL hydrolase family protein [Nonomuraea muscovyensis]MBB6348274.1 lysophospholipase L1-like esterase [Nonomuraea muscovyensis]MDF2708978.1 hydrolase family protein [Nonomuraea muscovyensis]